MSSQEPLAAPTGAQQQQPTDPNAKTSSLAIAGLVLGICSVFLWILTSIPGIICSAMALGRIRRSGGELQGQGLAVAGLTLSIIFSVFGIFWVGIMGAMLAGPLMNARASALHVASSNNMSQIGKACFQYGSPAYKGTPPASLDDLLKANLIDTEMMTNPLTQNKDYIFLPYDAKAPGSQIVLLEGPGSAMDGIGALFHDGHVSLLKIAGPEAQQEFADALRGKDIKAMQRLKEQYQLDFYIPTPNVPENRSSKRP